MTNKPLAWNHAVHGESEFWTHKNVSVVKNRDGTFDVLVDGNVLRAAFPDSAQALHYAHAYIEKPVGI